MDPAFVIATLSPLTWPVLTALGGLIHTAVARRRHADLLEVWIRWWLVGAAVGEVTIAVSFWVVPTFMADSMGYATGPYQFEVSLANLAFAAMLLISVRARETRLVVFLGLAIFLWGAAFGHVYQSVAHGNATAGNTGGILVYDFGIPLLLLILVLRQRARQK